MNRRAPPPGLGANVGDFDFLVGRWSVANRKLRERLVGNDEWDEFDAHYRAWTHLGGGLSIDEFDFGANGGLACSVRLLEIEAGTWSIYWVTATTGVLDSPVRGGWSGDRGEFYGADHVRGHPIEVRYLWHRVSPTTARWEQAFRTGGADWETNWLMTFTALDGTAPS
jgi:hypothetical protein